MSEGGPLKNTPRRHSEIDPESRTFQKDQTPAFAGVTALYECINISLMHAFFE
jgi:hypothetical protein